MSRLLVGALLLVAGCQRLAAANLTYESEYRALCTQLYRSARDAHDSLVVHTFRPHYHSEPCVNLISSERAVFQR